MVAAKIEANTSVLWRVNNILNSRHSAHCYYSVATFTGGTGGRIEKHLRIVESCLVKSFILFMAINNWLQKRLSDDFA